MITITIDYNNDEITVINDDFNRRSKFEFSTKLLYSNMIYSTSLFEAFLMKLLEVINCGGVEIEKIDEDKRTTLGEW